MIQVEVLAPESQGLGEVFKKQLVSCRAGNDVGSVEEAGLPMYEMVMSSPALTGVSALR